MKRSLAIVFSTLLALGAASAAFADGTAPAQAPQASAAPAAKPASTVQKGKHTVRKTRQPRKTSKKATSNGTGGKK